MGNLQQKFSSISFEVNKINNNQKQQLKLNELKPMLNDSNIKKKSINSYLKSRNCLVNRKLTSIIISNRDIDDPIVSNCETISDLGQNTVSLDDKVK